MPSSAETPAKPRTARPSAAVMLHRADGSAFEVLLAERNPKLRFFGGHWAFPGGTLDAMDVELAERLAGEEAGGEGTTVQGDPLVASRRVEDLALACCALRELFEETGVLLEPLRSVWPADDPDAAARRADLRAALSPREGATAEGRAAWLELCRSFADAGDLVDALAPIGRITTPGFRPLRYETLFLRAELPEGEEPVIHPGELVASRYARPADALAGWRRGEERVVPPVLFQLEFLADALDADGDVDAAWSPIAAAMDAILAGRLHSAYTSPGILAAPLRTPTLPPAATTNAYLVGTDDVYVVDPGPYDDGEGSERARLFETLDRWTSAGRRVRGVVLTHRHADHIGSASAVCARYDVPLFAHPATLEDLAPLWGEHELEASLSAGGGRRSLGPAPARQVPVDEGHAFDLGTAPDGSPDWKLVVHHTPGHARGHIVLRDGRYGAVVVGDMLSTLSTIVIDPPEGHLATYLDSLRRLIELGEDTNGGEWVLLPAHGPWTHRGQAACERYLAHRAEREASLVRALDAGLTDMKDLVAHVYADTDERAWPVAERSLEAGLEKLREEGRG